MFLGDIFGPDLIVVVIIVAVLIFGGAAIPKLARNLGSAKTEFEKGLKEGKNSGASQATDASRDEDTGVRQVAQWTSLSSPIASGAAKTLRTRPIRWVRSVTSPR